MNDFVIVTDSACDLNKDLRERFGIAEYMHGFLYHPDGREELADLDWNSVTPEAFYDSMKGKKVLYRTGCAALGEVEEIFEKHLSAGRDVLCIAMSSALSCTYQNCVNVALALQERYPERKILCVDSLRYSTSLALLLALASQKRESGASIEETAQYVESIKNCIHQMGAMDDLFFLVKTGRISNFKAFFGTLVGVNPMADFNAEGLACVLGKAKGKTAALQATVDYMRKTIRESQKQIIFIAHSNREAAAQRLSQMIKEEFSPKEIIITPVGMSCGASIGPGLCAAFYVGDPISADGQRERDIMAEVLNKENKPAQAVSEEPRAAAPEAGDFLLLTDSTCDLDERTREENGVEYVKMNYAIEGQEYPASLDWESHSAKDFYDAMRSGKRVTTTQVHPDSYRLAFTNALQKGMDVVYISCSSALSGSVNVAKTVAQEVLKDYPSGNIYCIDSLCSSLGQGMMVLWAARLRREGKTAREAAEYVENNKLNVNQCGTVASLEYLRRAGRVKASKAFFGNLFGVKPIIISDKLGQNYALKKAKGKQNAFAEIANMLADVSQGYDRKELYLSHADCLEDITLLRDEILKTAAFEKVHIGMIGPIVGASVGPGTVIAFCHGKKVEIVGEE